MRPCPLIRAAILALAALSAAACGSVGPGTDEPIGRAVVIYAPDREADAVDAAARLNGIGLAVAQEREGPPVRTRSSVAVYRVARDEALLATVEDAFDGFPDVEWLPFVHGGPPETNVVVWLVSTDRDEAARAKAAAEADASDSDDE